MWASATRWIVERRTSKARWPHSWYAGSSASTASLRNTTAGVAAAGAAFAHRYLPARAGGPPDAPEPASAIATAVEPL